MGPAAHNYPLSSGTEFKGGIGNLDSVLVVTKLLKDDVRGTIKGTGNICPKVMKRKTSALYVSAFKPWSLSEGKSCHFNVAALLGFSEPSGVLH